MIGSAAQGAAHSDPVASAAHCVAASTAAAVLIVLSWFNAVHSPAFDCVRAGAYLLRSRRGAVVPLVRVENSSVPIHVPLILVTPKEGFYVRR
jgi:hypothetical protein